MDEPVKEANKKTFNSLDSIDLTKFVLSIAIVSIHSGLGGGWQDSPIYPWARIAVPFFFITTAFLFFRKYVIADEEHQKLRINKFIKRNIQLYAFWLIALLIPTLVLREYFKQSVLLGLITIVRDFLFGSTFIASWYIMASIIAVCLISICMKKVPNYVILIAASICYIIACLSSNYGHLIMRLDSLASALSVVFKLFGKPYNNFIVALLWITIGKVVAEHETEIYSQYKTCRGRLLVLIALIIGCIMLFAEQELIRIYDFALANDCYIMLSVPTTALFIVVINTDLHLKHAAALRAASTITYCLHGTFIKSVSFVFISIGINLQSFFVLITTLIVCYMTTIVILRMESRPQLRVLLFSH